jgi:hypothetical protein
MRDGGRAVTTVVLLAAALAASPALRSASSDAAAPPAIAPAAIAPAATAPAATAPPATAATARIERRLLVKERHVFLSAGPGWLARGDYYTSPAVALSATYYLVERGGLELRGAVFSSSLDAAAREVRDATGLVPDAHRPRSFLAAGWRQSLGYGKVLAHPSLGVLHFDVQGAAAAGVLLTDRATTPALLAGPAVLARLGNRLVAQLDVSVWASFEPWHEASVSPGLLATLTVGAWL